MAKQQPPDETTRNQGQTEATLPGACDVDLKHVSGSMYAQVTICVFCVSILLVTDGKILAAGGDLQIPIVNLKIKQGSFACFGPIFIGVSLYGYLFLLKVLARVKAELESSDQYIFTIRNPADQVATHGRHLLRMRVAVSRLLPARRSETRKLLASRHAVATYSI